MLKATGIVRKPDELGRIVIPKELRKTFGIECGDSLEIFTDKDKIILRKYNPGDIFDGNMDDLVEYKGKKISKENIKEMYKLLK